MELVIDEPKFWNYIVETEEGGRYRRNQKFLKLLPNPNPVTDITPPKAVPRNTIKPEVELGLPRQSACEQALPKRFDDECAAAEVEHQVEYDRKERKIIRFCDAPPKCFFFRPTESAQKVMVGHQKAKRKRAENRVFLKKRSEISQRKPKSLKPF